MSINNAIYSQIMNELKDEIAKFGKSRLKDALEPNEPPHTDEEDGEEEEGEGYELGQEEGEEGAEQLVGETKPCPVCGK